MTMMEKNGDKPTGKIRLKEITLENAACFEKITIPFGENITVLTGTNGTGKTTVLNAIVGICASGWKIQSNSFVDILSQKAILVDESAFYKLFPGVREQQAKLRLKFTRNGNDEPDSSVNYEEREKIYPDYDFFRYPEQIIALNHKRFIEDEKTEGPKKEKSVELHSLDLSASHRLRLLTGYTGYSVKNFKQWLVNQDYLDLQAKQKGNRNKALDYFRENLAKIMPPEQSITLKEIVDMEPVFSTRTGDVPIGALSSGFQSVLSIYWNILYNLLNIYPQSENPFLENAIAVIDEVDAHLHPEWQQIIVHSLRTLFPNVQFIMATHSPLVVSGCGKNEAVFLKYDDENKCVVIDKDAPENPKGWLVESLLTGPFNLKTARGADVTEKIEKAKDDIVRHFASPLTSSDINELETLAENLDLPSDDPMKSILEIKNLRKMLGA